MDNQQQQLVMQMVNENKKLNKIMKEVKKVEKIAKPNEVILTNKVQKFREQDTRIGSYLSSLKYVDNGKFGSFPLANHVPYHFMKKQCITTTQVNPSGNLYIEICPSQFAFCASDGNARPMLQLNDASYLGPNSTGNSFGNSVSYGGLVQDCLLPSSIFHKAIVTGYSATITVTGVSALNRTGNIHIVEECDDQFTHGSIGNTSYSGINAYINGKPLSATVNLIHKIYKEYSNVNSNSITYKWIPPFGCHSGSIDRYDFDVSTSTAAAGVVADGDMSMKKIIIYAYGFPATAIIQIQHKVYYQATPRVNQIANYPMTYGSDFKDVTRELQMLACKTPFSLTDQTMNLGYSGGILQSYNPISSEEVISHYEPDDFEIMTDLSRKDITPLVNNAKRGGMPHQHKITKTQG